jgi:hypothetical protein
VEKGTELTPRAIRSKAQNYLLYEAGAYGNKLRTWTRFQDIERSGYGGRIVMRYQGVAGGAQYPRLGEQLTLAEVRDALATWTKLGAQLEAVAYNEAAPDHALLIQGEVMLSTEHISFFCSDEKTTMRKALQRGQQIDGVRALCLLRQHLFPSSWEDIQELLERFPDSVIEFSAFAHAVGFLRNRNTVIWEVRNY